MRYANLSIRSLTGACVAMTMGAFAMAQAPKAPAPVIDSPVEVVVPEAAVTVSKPLFVPPAGLTKPVEKLLWELGFLDSPTPQCTPFGYRFCMEVAIKCHVQRRYADSLAFVQRAVELRETSSALYLLALNQLAMNQCDEAAATVVRFKTTVAGRTDFEWLREKFSSPLTVRLRDLFEEL